MPSQDYSKDTMQNIQCCKEEPRITAKGSKTLLELARISSVQGSSIWKSLNMRVSRTPWRKPLHSLKLDLAKEHLDNPQLDFFYYYYCELLWVTKHTCFTRVHNKAVIYRMHKKMNIAHGLNSLSLCWSWWVQISSLDCSKY